MPVDTLFTNAQIVDVYGQRVAPGSVAVKDGVIVGVLYDGRDDAAGTYEATEVVDCQGRYLVPGLIDGHLHIESSNVRPAEYARMAATRGTTTAIADSHEIANVAGLDGLRFMIEDGRRAPISIKYMMPSCVPALPDEQAGAVITAADMQEFLPSIRATFLVWRNDEPAGRLYGRPRDLCSHRCCQPDAVQAG